MALLEYPILPLIGVGVLLYCVFKVLKFAKRIWHESLWSETFHFKKFGNWAVVTGSSDGIGKAVAEELANCGMNIVLMSRTKSKLERVASELEEKYGIKTKCVAIDFTSTEEIYEAVRDELEDLDVAVLVNNVGMAQVDPTALLDVPDYQNYSSNVCRVNLTAMSKMTEIVVPNMVKRGGGIVANVSSLIGSRECPYYAVYGSSKVFVIQLTKSLREEYKDSGVIFQCVAPGMTATPLTKVKSNFFIPDAKQYGKYFIKALGKSDYTNTSLFSHNVFQIMLKCFPDYLFAKAMSMGVEKAVMRRGD